MKKTEKLIWLMCTLLILTVTGACTAPQAPADPPDPDNGQEEPATPENPEEPGEAPQWDATIETTILIEGMEEPMTLHLLETGRFVTYVPEDMVPSVDADRVRIHTAFGGDPVDDAYLEISFLAQPATDLTTEEISAALGLEDFELNLFDPADHRHDWSVLEFYSHSHSQYSLAGFLGERNGTSFVVIMHYPWEYGDGFAPRADLILNHLHWMPEAEPLVS